LAQANSINLKTIEDFYSIIYRLNSISTASFDIDAINARIIVFLKRRDVLVFHNITVIPDLELDQILLGQADLSCFAD